VNADDWLEAVRIVIANTKQDPINNAVMPLIGAAAVFALWYWGIVSWETIKMFLCLDLC